MILGVGLYLTALFFFLSGNIAFADTINLKTGDEIKGIVVEEYRDRIIVSTFEGEKTLLKRDVGNISYDEPEQNLKKLGDTYVARREYEKAYFYYEKALNANPKDATARDKMNYVMGYMFRKREQGKLDDMKRRQDFEEWPLVAPKKEEDFGLKLARDIGISIAEDQNRIKIKEVRKSSPAFNAGIETGDTLVSVWGRFTGYMSKNEVERLVLEESFGEVKVALERDIRLGKDRRRGRYCGDIIDGKLDILIDGLTITGMKDDGAGYKAGLRKNDLIVAIDRFSTRYMPLKNAIAIIENRNVESVVFTVRRDMTMWRK